MEHKHLSFFRTNHFVQNPAGRGEGAGLETPYELDVKSLSPASIESKALAKSDESAPAPGARSSTTSSAGYAKSRHQSPVRFITSVGAFYRRQNAATHRYSAMPKQTRKHSFGGNPWTGKPKRDPSRLEDTSAKQRKQHAHKAPVRRAASKFRG